MNLHILRMLEGTLSIDAPNLNCAFLHREYRNNPKIFGQTGLPKQCRPRSGATERLNLNWAYTFCHSSCTFQTCQRVKWPCPNFKTSIVQILSISKYGTVPCIHRVTGSGMKIGDIGPLTLTVVSANSYIYILFEESNTSFRYVGYAT